MMLLMLTIMMTMLCERLLRPKTVALQNRATYQEWHMNWAETYAQNRSLRGTEAPRSPTSTQPPDPQRPKMNWTLPGPLWMCGSVQASLQVRTWPLAWTLRNAEESSQAWAVRPIYDFFEFGQTGIRTMV